MSELAALADELYALTPTEFTKARNERSKQARAEDKELAARVQRLPKPSTAAWIVNMLVRYQADQLGQVLDLGAAMRAAQENLDGDELRELSRQRRQLTHAVSGEARGLAHRLGVRVSDAVTAQVEETLRAAMTDEDAARAVRTGQLVEALSATGVGGLDVSAAVAVPEALGMSARPVAEPVATKPQLQVVPDTEPDTRLLEQASRAVEQAQVDAEAAERKLGKARRRVTKLEARSLELSGQLEEVRRRAGEIEYELENVDDDLSAAEEQRDQAQDRHDEATVAVQDARAELDRLTPRPDGR